MNPCELCNGDGRDPLKPSLRCPSCKGYKRARPVLVAAEAFTGPARDAHAALMSATWREQRKASGRRLEIRSYRRFVEAGTARVPVSVVVVRELPR